MADETPEDVVAGADFSHYCERHPAVITVTAAGEAKPCPLEHDPRPGVSVHSNSIAVRISREMAVAHGLVEPTYEERMATYQWALERRAKKADARALFEHAKAAIAALDPEQWPIATKVLALHAPKAPYPGDRELPPVCDGCPPDNEHGEHGWPCATVQAVCEFPGIGIVLPDHDLLEEDYEPVHPDDQPPWEPRTIRSMFPKTFVNGTFIDYFDAKKEGSGG